MLKRQLGKVYLIPAPLYELESSQIAQQIKSKSIQIKHYFVENIRTARRVLKSFDNAVIIDDITFYLCNHKSKMPISEFINVLNDNLDVGIMSEAGIPAIADPGNQLVMTAHEMGAEVIPLVGPNSIILALSASGLNGQQFKFLGYLPIENSKRVNTILEMCKNIQRYNETQIFIETPYRNQQLFEVLIQNINHDYKLCIAAGLQSENEFIKTGTISFWKNNKPDIHKIPAIFLIGK